MAKNDSKASVQNLDTSGIREPQFSPDEAQAKMNRILEGSRKGGATTREMIRFAKQNMGPNWKERATGVQPSADDRNKE